MAEIDDIKHEVTLANRMLVEMELAGGPTIERGHVSFRLPNAPDTFLIKALGPALSRMDESDPNFPKSAIEVCLVKSSNISK